ncbi:MAG TPA: hypothetical protein VK175_03500 [Leadbetterella sp.]|nr:hypothetical protein [Leadbetterella sp.]
MSKIAFQFCLTICLFFLSYTLHAQQEDSTSKIINFRASSSITNNGFSFIPAFSLGKPAAIFNLNINDGKRFSFDPEFRFSLQDGRPWSFIFIWRYKLINQKRLQASFGTHFPAVPFRVLIYETTPDVKTTLAVSRVIPFEFLPNFVINKNHSLSLFCLYAKGVTDDAINHTGLLSLRSVSNFPISKKLNFRVNPQLFYLKLDKKDGYYFASNFTLSSKSTPFYVGSTINKPIKTDIAGKSFDWNLSLGYSLDRKLIVKK